MESVMRLLILLTACTAASMAQDFQRNTVMFHGGNAWSVQNYSRGYDTGVSLGGTYEFCFRRFIGAEAGALTTLQPSQSFGTKFGTIDPDDRIVWVPFGIRLHLPLGRFEVSLGGGGLHESYTISNDLSGYGYQKYSGWGGYVAPRVTFALDRRRRFAVGATPWVMFGNPQYARDRFVILTGDFSVRF